MYQIAFQLPSDIFLTRSFFEILSSLPFKYDPIELFTKSSIQLGMFDLFTPLLLQTVTAKCSIT